MATARYVLAVLLVISLPPAVFWWILIHPFVGFWRHLGVAATLWINGILMVGGFVGLWVARDTLVGRDLGGHPALVVAGVICLAISIRIALKRRRHLTFRILSGVPELQRDGKGGALLTEGPYAVMRHPRYVEVVVGTLGYALLANHTGAYVVTLAMVPLLHLVVLIEERELVARFGDAYLEYAARVPRYLPRSFSGSPRP
jgi:protein-S-isoprenylcysteine O-methyltransferase Ste14